MSFDTDSRYIQFKYIDMRVTFYFALRMGKNFGLSSGDKDNY